MPPLARFRIPKPIEGGFAKIVALDNDAFLQLLSALEETPSTYKPETVVSRLLAKAKTISADDINEIMMAVLSLYSVREGLNLPDAEFVEQVALAMENTSHREILYENENRTRFKARLTSLVNSVFLSVLSKVVSLTSEHERVFQDARIVTDIRAAFVSQPEDQPKAAVLNHMLRIAYGEGGEGKAFFVALDSNDLTNLIEVLDRAKKKARTLEAILKESGISFLSAE